jgi:hypothetical protein
MFMHMIPITRLFIGGTAIHNNNNYYLAFCPNCDP